MCVWKRAQRAFPYGVALYIYKKKKLAAQLLAGAVYMYMRGIYVYAWIFIYNNRANKTKREKREKKRDAQLPINFT